MDPYRKYKAHNQGPARDANLPSPPPPEAGPALPPPFRGASCCPKVAIYAGEGGSHSWLWFAEIFQRLGLWDLSFLDENHIIQGGLKGCQVLAVSGGDTFGMARALGTLGAAQLAEFINKGGLYLGACAGAYLPLRSSKTPLNLFNYVNAKIANLTSALPKAKDLAEKFCTPYGCSFVFHPVREEMLVRLSGRAPFRPAKASPRRFTADPP